MPVFIEYDTQEAHRKANGSTQRAELLFVDCNNGGRPSENSRARLNRHAAITSVSTGAKKSPSPTEALQDDNQLKGEADPAARASARVPRTTLKFRLDKRATSSKRLQKHQTPDKNDIVPVHIPVDPRAAQLVTNAHLGAFRSPSPNVSNDMVAVVINWFFYGKEQATSRSTLQVATGHWMKQLWDWAFTHEELFEGVALNVMKKRIDIAGANAAYQSDYFKHKGQIIRRLRDTVAKEGSTLATPTMFVIANMAIHAFQDGDIKAARMHLEALEAIRAPEKIEPYEWIGTWIVDFRLALILSCKPAFSYYLPYDHKNMVPKINQQLLKDRTAESVDLLPKSTAYNDDIRSLAHQTWQFYLAWPKLKEFKTEPFGMIYNLEFALRTLHPQVLLDEGEAEPSAAVRRSIQLVIHAVQFHLWIAARYWEPLSWGVRMFVLKRALGLLTSSADFLNDWMDESGGSPSALVWILSMLTALCLDEGGGLAPIPLLSRAIDLADIEDNDDFMKELKRWPWLDNWHGVHATGVWEQIMAYRASTGQSADVKPSRVLWQATLTSKPESRKLFVGAVEFYDI